jgi:hypothetical protein
LIKGDDNFERDQHNDNEFKAQRSKRIDDVSESVGCFGHHGRRVGHHHISPQSPRFMFFFLLVTPNWWDDPNLE